MATRMPRLRLGHSALARAPRRASSDVVQPSAATISSSMSRSSAAASPARRSRGDSRTLAFASPSSKRPLSAGQHRRQHRAAHAGTGRGLRGASRADTVGRRTRRIWELSRAATRDFIRTLRQPRVSAASSARAIPCTTRSHREALPSVCGANIAGGTLPGSAGDGSMEPPASRRPGIEERGRIRTHGNAQVDPYRACLGFMRRGSRHRRGALRAIAGGGVEPSRDGVAVDDARAARVTCRTDRDRDRLRHAGIRAARRAVSHAASPTSSPRAACALRERRRLGLGDVMLWDTGAAVSLRALDGGPPADARRRAIDRA